MAPNALFRWSLSVSLAGAVLGPVAGARAGGRAWDATLRGFAG